MDTTTPAVTPLRQRMTEDMRMRKLEARTQDEPPAAAIPPIIAPRATTAANRTSPMSATKAVSHRSVGHSLEWRGYKRFVAAIEYGHLGPWLRP